MTHVLSKISGVRPKGLNKITILIMEKIEQAEEGQESTWDCGIVLEPYCEKTQDI
jgi:hypothetical protein